uniref:Opioid growth factor receptor (OGFr) conserved domain-containing protein n=1 Tax=Leptobrachium leishanense TaxID=445787 RepID=A0A8C5PSU9_9ANUR
MPFYLWKICTRKLSCFFSYPSYASPTTISIRCGSPLEAEKSSTQEKTSQIIQRNHGTPRAVWKPSAVSVMHCRGHQKGHDEIPKGNRLADQAAKAAAKPTTNEYLLKHQVSKILLCKQNEDDCSSMPNYEFFMNWRKYDPNGEFIEIVLRKWVANFEVLEDNHDYIQWLFPTNKQGRNFYSKPLTPEEKSLICNTSEIQQRLLRAYKMMLKFFGVKVVGEITRVLLSLGELGAEEYQAPLVKFLLNEILIEHRLPNMKKSAMNFFVPAVKDAQERQDLLYFAWLHYQPKEEFIWGTQEELEKYKVPPSMIAPLLPAPLSEWTPLYSEKETKWLSEEPGKYGEDRWFQLASNQIVLPATLAPEIDKSHVGCAADCTQRQSISCLLRFL